MGGKLFNASRRIDLTEHNEILERMIESIGHFGKIPLTWTELHKYISGIKSYHMKDSFGDVDILVNTDYIDIEYFLHSKENEYKVSKNKDSSIISLFGVEEVQIDLILVNSNQYNSYLNYLNYNCVGNFMGKLAHGLSLKFGLDGLFIPVKYDNQIIDNIIISTNIKEICIILDLDFDVYRNGFNTLEDIFKFIMNSKHYNRSLFELDSLSSKNKQRNKKNKNYLEFLNYIECNDTIPRKYHIMNIYEGLMLFRHNSRIMSEYLHIQFSAENKKKRAKLFNGNLVQKETGLKDNELGYFMKSIKSKIDYTQPIPLQIIKLFNEYKENTL